MVSIIDVKNAQKAWGEGIVAISSAYSNGSDYVERARFHIESLYAYSFSSVLFKPTFAVEEQFRPTFEGALSYFVGGNSTYSEDNGFAIKGWTGVRFENKDIIINGTSVMTMGNYFFMTSEGNEIKVEYSFGYIVDNEGKLRIQLHHSSMPAII
tara:strand:- start:9554 stop:10015 length:462 start_codon:yes stop_codon:yes gene_type:complete